MGVAEEGMKVQEEALSARGWLYGSINAVRT